MWNHINFIFNLKQKIPFPMKLLMIRILVFIQSIFYSLFPKHIEINKDSKNVYLLLSTDYSNLGDHALTYSHKKMIEQLYPDANIVEIVVNDTLKTLAYLRKNIQPGDIVTLKGGGNIGIEYFREELIRRKIIRYITDNKIVIFPQTVYFPNTKVGNREFEKTIDIFKGNDQLYLFLRDKFSYDTLLKENLDRIYLVPDIVFSLGKIALTTKRDGIMVTMRDDVEGIYSQKEKEKLDKIVNSLNMNVKYLDTIRDYKIEIVDRESELMSMLKEIANSKIVITDRLHGMIFSYLTNTPCVVLKTYNHKLIGQYEWLSNCNGVYLKDIEDINQEFLNKVIDENVDDMKFDYQKLVTTLQGEEK